MYCQPSLPPPPPAVQNLFGYRLRELRDPAIVTQKEVDWLGDYHNTVSRRYIIWSLNLLYPYDTNSSHFRPTCFQALPILSYSRSVHPVQYSSVLHLNATSGRHSVIRQ